MKRLITATALTTAVTLAQAAPLYHPPGSNLTYGAVSNGQSIVSDITNPAAGAAVLTKNGNQYRLGIPGSIGAGFEFGEVDDLYDRIDQQKAAFDTGLDNILTNTTDVAVIGADIQVQVDNINSILSDVEANGYAKAFASVDIPLVIAHKGLGGSLALDINKSFSTRASGLHETIDFDSTSVILTPTQTIGDITIDLSGNNITIDNDSTILIKASMVTDLSLGYSRPVFKTDEATLYAGARAHHYTVEQSRLAVRMTDLVDVQQQFEDALDQDRSSDTGMGLDVGMLWVSEHYRAGATLTNINEPDFDTGTIDLTGYTLSGPIAQQLISDNKFTMEKQLTVEAALYTANQNWVISGAYDANAVEDSLGDEYQWATVSAAYATDSWFLPGFRGGIRKNLAGTEINYYSLGLTLAMVNLDLAWSTDKVTIDGDSVPRGAMVNLGIELSF